MSPLRCLILFALIPTISGCTPSDTFSLSDLDIENLRATRSTLMQAMIEGDIETIEQIYSDDYELVTRNGSLRSRTERIEMLESGKLRYINLGTESEVSVKIYGNIAVVRGIISAAETEYNGERRISTKRRFIEIWECMNSDWQEISRQTTAIIDSAP